MKTLPIKATCYFCEKRGNCYFGLPDYCEEVCKDQFVGNSEWHWIMCAVTLIDKLRVAKNQYLKEMDELYFGGNE